MLKYFRDLIGRTIEAYVDDSVVKSKWADLLIADLERTFAKLQANGVKLNPKKCIEANPEKISAITRMGPIQNIKGVQLVTRCLAMLSHFISCLSE